MPWVIAGIVAGGIAIGSIWFAKSVGEGVASGASASLQSGAQALGVAIVIVGGIVAISTLKK